MALLDSLSALLAFISLHLRLLFLRAGHFFAHRVLYATLPGLSTGAVRTVLLLGDATAAGLGDQPGRRGLVAHLSALFRKQAADVKLRLHWHVVTAGEYGAHAQTWMPNTEGRLERALQRFPRADVVVLLFGMQDDLSNGANAPAVTAIITTAITVARKGMQVVVPLLPDLSHHGRDRAAVRQANDTITEALRDVDVTPGRVVVAGDLGKVAALGMDVLRVEKYGFTWNPRGYRVLAGELFEEIAAAARRSEWATFKRVLAR